jgi:hypothetical protein
MWANLTFLGFSALLIWASVKFLGWFRQRSPRAVAWTEFKTSLPGWVKLFELCTQAAFWVAIFFALFRGFFALHHAWHPAEVYPGDTAEGLILFSCLSGALVPSMMLANIISWIVPAVRNANLRTLEMTTSESLGGIMKGLAKLGIPLTLTCLIFAAVGAWEPWIGGHP